MFENMMQTINGRKGAHSTHTHTKSSNGQKKKKKKKKKLLALDPTRALVQLLERVFLCVTTIYDDDDCVCVVLCVCEREACL